MKAEATEAELQQKRAGATEGSRQWHELHHPVADAKTAVVRAVNAVAEAHRLNEAAIYSARPYSLEAEVVATLRHITQEKGLSSLTITATHADPCSARGEGVEPDEAVWFYTQQLKKAQELEDFTDAVGGKWIESWDGEGNFNLVG